VEAVGRNRVLFQQRLLSLRAKQKGWHKNRVLSKAFVLTAKVINNNLLKQTV